LTNEDRWPTLHHLRKVQKKRHKVTGEKKAQRKSTASQREGTKRWVLPAGRGLRNVTFSQREKERKSAASIGETGTWKNKRGEWRKK